VKDKNIRLGLWAASAALFTLGLSYGSVPLYKVFCRMTAYGGTAQVNSISDTNAKLKNMKPVSAVLCHCYCC